MSDPDTTDSNEIGTLENYTLASTLVKDAMVLSAEAVVVEDAGAESRDGTDDSSIEIDAETDNAWSRDAAKIDMDGAEGEVEGTTPFTSKGVTPA